MVCAEQESHCPKASVLKWREHGKCEETPAIKKGHEVSFCVCRGGGGAGNSAFVQMGLL